MGWGEGALRRKVVLVGKFSETFAYVNLQRSWVLRGAGMSVSVADSVCNRAENNCVLTAIFQ